MKLRYILSIAACIYVGMLSSKTIYKKIDSNGNVSYSDTPFPQSKAIELPNLDQQTTLPAVELTPTLEETPDPIISQSITILSPAQDETIRNNEGNITIMVQKKQLTRKSLKTQVLVNGELYKKTFQGTVLKLNNIYRGETSLQVQLLDHSGNVLATSQEVIVHVHRKSIINAN